MPHVRGLIADTIFSTVDVTLRSDGAEDSYYFRSITLSDDKPRIDIGRASKRSGGRGPPTMHNAYFTKNVVSREHAALFIKRESKVRDQSSWLEIEFR